MQDGLFERKLPPGIPASACLFATIGNCLMSFSRSKACLCVETDGHFDSDGANSVVKMGYYFTLMGTYLIGAILI